MSKKDPRQLAEPVVIESDGKYFARFRRFREDGTTGVTKTGKFNTPKQAKAAAIARQKVSLGLLDKGILDKRKKSMELVVDEYLKLLDKKRKAPSVKKESQSQTVYENLQTVKKKFMPPVVATTKVGEVDEKVFVDWVKHINNYVDEEGKELSYNRVSRLRTTVSKVAKYMDDYRYFDDADMYKRIKDHIRAYELKDKDVGKTFPNIPTYDEIKALCSVCDKTTFEGLYYYTLFYVAFFTCMRFCELIALTWDHVDFELGFITIDNSINKRENRDNVALRKEHDVGETKNAVSVREISMMRTYYTLLKNYKTNYAFAYGLQDKPGEMAKAYVFPAVQQKRFSGASKPYNIYQNNDIVNEHIDFYTAKYNALDEKDKLPGIDKVRHISCGKFRHGGCSYLATYHNWFEAEMIDYMGHVDSSMIRKVYEKITMRTRAIRTRQRHPEMFYMNIPLEDKQMQDIKKKVETHVAGEAMEKRQHEIDKKDLHEQIIHLASLKQKTEYFYRPDQQQLIDEIVAEHPTISKYVELKKIEED